MSSVRLRIPAERTKANQRRNGGKYYTCNRDDKCHDCGTLRSASIQGHEGGLPAGENGELTIASFQSGLLTSEQIFLERSGARAINTEQLRPPNPNCPVCGVAQARLVIDPARATLSNLVEDVLRDQLEYGEELTVNNEIGIVYDPDLDDNLPKKFSELGIKEDSFLTIIDDEGDAPRVNLQLMISMK
jgi:hypothetical protein